VGRRPAHAGQAPPAGTYLAAWLPALLQGRADRVTYAEGFAGPGIYKGGEPNSPIVALRAFPGHRDLLAAGRTVDMVLVEEDSCRLAELRRQMGRALSDNPAKAAGSTSSTSTVSTGRYCSRLAQT
jgi:three-Cys-motif partner protein